VERSSVIIEDILLHSMEDIVILMIMLGERKDINDVKKILPQTRRRLNRGTSTGRLSGQGLKGS